MFTRNTEDTVRYSRNTIDQKSDKAANHGVEAEAVMTTHCKLMVMCDAFRNAVKRR